jgi:hypothetical protein
MRLRVLLAVFLVEFLSALPACSATSEIDVPAAEFFFGWARISGSAAATRYVCPAGRCVRVTDSVVRNHYDDLGWGVSIAGNLNRFSGIEFDASCCQKPEWPNGHQYTFLVGPRFVYRGSGRLQPFAHVLLGMAHGSQATPYQYSTWRPGFASALGGGIDVKLIRFVWIRAFEADYLRASFKEDVQKNSRMSFGIVVRFGSLRKSPS